MHKCLKIMGLPTIIVIFLFIPHQAYYYDDSLQNTASTMRLPSNNNNLNAGLVDINASLLASTQPSMLILLDINVNINANTLDATNHRYYANFLTHISYVVGINANTLSNYSYNANCPTVMREWDPLLIVEPNYLLDLEALFVNHVQTPAPHWGVEVISPLVLFHDKD